MPPPHPGVAGGRAGGRAVCTFLPGVHILPGVHPPLPGAQRLVLFHGMLNSNLNNDVHYCAICLIAVEGLKTNIQCI